MPQQATTSLLPAQLAVAGVSIRRDNDGRFCLNDLHRAAGGENKHRPSLWTANRQTADLIAELQAEAGIPALASEHGGVTPGTYVVKELVYAYAMWISPAFHLRVIRAYDSMVTAPAKLDPTSLSRMDLIKIALDAETERLALAHQVQELEPKAAALERIAEADGSYCIRDAAKILQLRPVDLRDWLVEHKWIYGRPGNAAWLGYQDRIQQGVLTHKVTTVPRADGSEKTVSQVRVTPKGLAKLGEYLRGVA